MAARALRNRVVPEQANMGNRSLPQAGKTSAQDGGPGPALNVQLPLIIVDQVESDSSAMQLVREPKVGKRIRHQAHESRVCTNPYTKSQILATVTALTEEILSVLKTFNRDRTEDFSHKRKCIEAKIQLSEAKRQEYEARRKGLEMDIILQQISLLKEQRSLDLITEDELKEKCRLVFGM